MMLLRGVASALALIGALHFAMPAQACIKTTPAVRAWVNCSYAVASKTDDHRFLMNFVRAKRSDKKLLPGAQTRWEKLRQRFNAGCGTFAAAAKRDVAILPTLNGPYDVPRDEYDAFINTAIDERVKPNA